MPARRVAARLRARCRGALVRRAGVQRDRKCRRRPSVVEIDLSRVAERIAASRAPGSNARSSQASRPFFAEALLAAVRRVPQANAAFDAEAGGIRRYSAVQLGMSVAAADGESARHGVIRDADTRNALGLAMAIEALRADGSAEPDCLLEATICLTDYGPGSALFAVPLVLPGQAAAIRVGAVEERLLVRERGFGLRRPPTCAPASTIGRSTGWTPAPCSGR